MNPAEADRGPGAPSRPAQPVRLPGIRPSVLIADDDPGVVHVLSARCRRLGLAVTTAFNGLQAILKARQSLPDLVIVDINMPELDGFKVCEWLLDPARPPMNIIVLTGSQEAETYERCDSLGAYYVPKSSETWDVLRTIIQEMFGLATAEPEPGPLLPPRQTVFRLPVSGPRILIVDDDPDMIAVLESRLRKLGATIFSARNGIEAFRIAQREQPHVVIADYVMPEAGGHYLIWRLRQNANTADVPIIIITGEADADDDDFPWGEGLVGPEGATKVLRKPFLMDDLLAAVRSHCGLLQPAPATPAL